MLFKHRLSFNLYPMVEEKELLVIMKEMRMISGHKEIMPAISMFGSARTKSTDRYYIMAENIAYKLSNMGLSVISGGGPGIMEAVNKGAFHGKSHSIGLNINLPKEQGANKYQNISFNFHYFFTRKVMFVKYSSAYIVFPGGIGTLDELFEVMTLMQTGKIKHFPIILVGKEFWSDSMEWMKKDLLTNNMINASDLKLITLVDSEDEVNQCIEEFYARNEHHYCLEERQNLLFSRPCGKPNK